jgi:MerR family transcriptional regulator, mercuric resistance operon regulatory protein
VEHTEFRIGEVATRAGVSVDAVRYYESLKLVPCSRRMSGKFRLFGVESIERIRFIKQAQALGFTLDEIKGLLVAGGAEECRRVRDLLSKKIENLDGKMKAIKEFRRTLVRHLSACERELKAHGDAACCPIVAGDKNHSSQSRGGKKNIHG